MMTAEDLIGAILTLAMQGKIVEQDRKEGTAEELFESILALKKDLVKAGTIKKDKIQSPIKEEEIPHDIPDTWRWARFSDLFDIGSAMRIHQSDWQKEGIPFLRGRELIRLAKAGDPEAEIFISEELYQKNKEKGGVPQKDDLLVTAVGTIGKVYVVKGTKPFYYKDAYILRFNNFGGVYPKFFKYVIESPFEQSFIKAGSMGTTVAQLTIQKAKRMLCPLPPLEEQKRIVAKIEELMPFVEQYAKASTRLNTLNASFPYQMKKSILQQAVMGKLVPQDPSDEPASVLLEKIAEEKQKLIKEGKIKKQKASNVVVSDDKPFEIPESWAWATLADLAKQITDGEHSTPKRSTKYDGYYLLSARNVRDGSIQLTDVDYVDKSEFDRISSRCNPTRGDILISCSGSVGRCTVVDDDNKYVMVRSAAMVSPVMCNPKYLMYAIQSECVQSQINGLKKQTAQANLFLGAISVLMIPVPPIEEQNRIVGKLEDTFKHIEGSLKDSIQ